MRFRAVLFDAVGTLVALREPVGEVYAREARAAGPALPAWRLEDAFRRVRRAAPPMCFPDAPPESVPEREQAWWRALVRQTLRAADSTVILPDFDAFFERLWRHYARPDAWRLRPGARAALAALRAEGRATAVASNFDHRLPDLLEGLGIANLLDTIWIPARCGVAKPDPRFFAGALAALDAAPEEALYVGDDPAADVAGAAAAGLAAMDVRDLATLDALPDAVRAREAQEDPCR